MIMHILGLLTRLTLGFATSVALTAPLLYAQGQARSELEKPLHALPETLIVRLLEQYESISNALVADDLGLANAFAADLSAATQEEGLVRISNLSMDVAGAETLEEARKAFKLLSKYVIPMATGQGNYITMVCPMEPDGRWLQSGTTTANPYMGQSMPRCGKPEVSIRPDGVEVSGASGCCGS